MNVGIIVTNFITTVHSTTMGIVMNEQHHQADDYFRDVLISKKPKDEIN
jgi:hypothetical protein